jgi:hypothetical protein
MIGRSTSVSCSFRRPGDDGGGRFPVTGRPPPNLRGTSTSQYGLKATSVTGSAILAQTTSGPYAISASAGLGEGVFGTTTSGSGYGIVGTVSGSGTGTYGSSSSGIGVQAIAGSGYGLFAQNAGGGKATIFANSTSGNAAEFRATYIGVLSRTPSGGYGFVATNPGGTANVFYVDGAGNISYKGGLFHFASLPSGATVKSFSPSTTLPTVEDTGTAQLRRVVPPSAWIRHSPLRSMRRAATVSS